MARQFRRLGTAWGVVRNLADTPLFIDSRASRMVQLAGHVAYAVFRRYEHGDSQYFDVVASRFDSADGVYYRWYSEDASTLDAYVFGGTFPARLITDASAIRSPAASPRSNARPSATDRANRMLR